MDSERSSAAPSYALRSRSLPVNILPGVRRQSTLASIVLRKKNEVDIILDGGSEFVHSYTTHDEIKGNVELKFEKDVRIDELIVTFEGQSATYIEKLATTAPTTGKVTGKHTFLKLLQPVDDDQLPEDNLAKAGVTYSIPFHFVVPDRLLPYVCSHKADNDEVKKAHLQLPPSLGEPSVSGDGHMLMDDFSPAMAKIVYGIHARVTSRNASGRTIIQAEKTERIRIVPAKGEEPPIDVDDNGVDYVLRKEKNVRKGIFKIGKVGRLTAETSQPPSLRLPHPQKKITQPINTMTTVQLRFDPASSEDEPPRLGAIVSKLRTFTFFGATAYRSLPEPRRCDNWSSLHGLYPDSIEISSRCLSTVAWVKHDGTRKPSASSEDLSRRPSTYSTISSVSIPEPSTAYQSGSPYYTASVVVPISLPDPYTTNRPKVFVPSFHSCIISRSYSLELNISYHTPGTNVSSPHITLKTPIQISSEGSALPEDPEADAALVAEIERQFNFYQDHYGPESPEYTDAGYPPISTTRHASLASGAPPEYHVTEGYLAARQSNLGTRHTVSLNA